MSDKLISKVLVLDNNPGHADVIKRFCDENNLIPLKVRKNRLMALLRSNIDLGAILYSGDYADSPEDTAAIAMQIHAICTELPIVIRREKRATLEDLSQGQVHFVRNGKSPAMFPVSHCR